MARGLLPAADVCPCEPDCVFEVDTLADSTGFGELFVVTDGEFIFDDFGPLPAGYSIMLYDRTDPTEDGLYINAPDGGSNVFVLAPEGDQPLQESNIGCEVLVGSDISGGATGDPVTMVVADGPDGPTLDLPVAVIAKLAETIAIVNAASWATTHDHAYLSLGTEWGNGHEDGAFISDETLPDLTSTDGWEVEYLIRPVGNGGADIAQPVYFELFVTTFDGIGAADINEDALLFELGYVRPFDEWIEPGQTSETYSIPTETAAAWLPLGAWSWVLRRLEFTAANGNGRLSFYRLVYEQDKDTITVRGRFWRLVSSTVLATPTAVITGAVHPVMLGAGQGFADLGALRAFDGIGDTATLIRGPDIENAIDPTTVPDFVLGTYTSVGTGIVVTP